MDNIEKELFRDKLKKLSEDHPKSLAPGGPPGAVAGVDWGGSIGTFAKDSKFIAKEEIGVTVANLNAVQKVTFGTAPCHPREVDTTREDLEFLDKVDKIHAKDKTYTTGHIKDKLDEKAERMSVALNECVNATKPFLVVIGDKAPPGAATRQEVMEALCDYRKEHKVMPVMETAYLKDGKVNFVPPNIPFKEEISLTETEKVAFLDTPRSIFEPCPLRTRFLDAFQKVYPDVCLTVKKNPNHLSVGIAPFGRNQIGDPWYEFKKDLSGITVEKDYLEWVADCLAKVHKKVSFKEVNVRWIASHQVNPCNEDLVIAVMDEPGAGGANHEYLITGHKDQKGVYEVCRINFQKGPIKENGTNGVTQEALIAILIDRLQAFQNGPYKCRENAIALTKLEEAQMWLHKRTRERMARGVEGTHIK